MQIITPGCSLNNIRLQVGGLQGHVEALKEMVVMPLLYPEVFTSLGVTAPRGVLLHGHNPSPSPNPNPNPSLSPSPKPNPNPNPNQA